MSMFRCSLCLCLQRQLVSVHEALATLNYYSEVLTILSSDLFTDAELNVDALHHQIRPETGNQICETSTKFCNERINKPQNIYLFICNTQS